MCYTPSSTDDRLPAVTTKRPTDAIEAIALAKNTIEIAVDVLSLYDDIESQVPWAEFITALSNFDDYIDEYTEQSGSFATNIYHSLKEIVNQYFVDASRRASKWCSFLEPIVTAYVELFTTHSVSKAIAQNGLLQLLLVDGVERSKVTKFELQIISINLNRIADTLKQLLKQFALDFNVNSRFFQEKLSKTNRKTSCILPNICEMNKSKLINELKERLAIVSQFHINLKESINRASIKISTLETALSMNVANFEHIIHLSNLLNNFIPIVNKSRDFEDFVKKTQNLLTKCTVHDAKPQSIDNN